MLYGQRAELERYMAHFGVDEEGACLLMMAGIPLPPRGTAGVPNFNVGVALNVGEEDPTFDAGSLHTVTITITNLTNVAWTIDVKFAAPGIGPDWVPSDPTSPTGFWAQVWDSVSLPANDSAVVSALIYMSSVAGVYPCMARVTEKDTGTDESLDFSFEDVSLITPAFLAEASVSWI